jgi:acid phosphatase
MKLPFPSRFAILALLCLCLVGAGCGDSTSSPTRPDPPPSKFGHVFLVVEENHSYSDVIEKAGMPYLTSLASTYGLATQYYADTHPSIGNYFMLTTGVVYTDNEAVTPPTFTDDNIVRELLAIGRTWKSYAESLPSVGYTGPDVFPYAQHHNPFVFLSDVTGDQLQNLVPFSQFASDLASNSLPNFSFIIPNQLNNAHDGPLSQADDWLRQNIEPLISSPVFQKDGLLIILFDESDFSDLAHGGGRVATVIISPHGKRGFKSDKLYQHPSTLRLILKSLGATKFPGAAATAPDMDEFF